jgi:hypothetical protein
MTSRALKGVPQEAVIETRVVRDEDAVFKQVMQFVGDVHETRRASEIGVGNAGEVFDERRNGNVRVDQCLPFALAAVRLDQHDADLDDAVHARVRAGGFKIDKGEGARVHGDSSRLRRHIEAVAQVKARILARR